MSRTLTRRSALAGLAAAGTALLAGPALARSAIDATDLGLEKDVRDDQSAVLQAAIDEAERAGRPLFIPGGVYFVSTVRFPRQGVVEGVPGATMLAGAADGRVAYAEGAWALTVRGLKFDRGMAEAEDGGLFEASGCETIRFSDCLFFGSPGHGLTLTNCGASVERCEFRGHNFAAIFALDGRQSKFTGNTITQCNNNGILVWGREAGHKDGTIVSGNHIDEIGYEVEGNGQNGNGINVFRADGVIVSDNSISRSMFTAIRLNATNNSIVSGNSCFESGEVAIFSEFEFSGSVIADNIIDGAAAGITMTNLDVGGHLAVCSGNLVRNIYPKSEVNPDTVPYGIFAEADAIITSNVIEAVPGLGIGAGWGPYLRNVSVTGNLVRDVDIGIGVSVAEGAGSALVSGNHVSGARRAGIAAMAWQDVVSDDLARDAGQFPNVGISGNRVS